MYPVLSVSPRDRSAHDIAPVTRPAPMLGASYTGPMLACLCLLLFQTRPIDSLDSLASHYSIKVEVVTQAYLWQGEGYKVVSDAVPATDLARYTPLFVKEWSLYPVSLMAKARVRRIVIGSNIRMDGQPRAAVPASDDDTLYYDATLGAKVPHYQRIVLHHEFFHLIDDRSGWMRRDPDWAALNLHDFHYGSGGDKMREHGSGELTDKIPGFLTPYGTSAVEEDKAELFAHLVVDPEFVKKRAAADPVVASKIKLLKSRLAQFDPDMGEAFWKQMG